MMNKYKTRLPSSSDVKTAVMRVLDSGRFYRYDTEDEQPSEVSLLEKDMCDYLGAKYSVAVTSCTSALNIAMYVLGVTSEDEVLIPAFTFVAVPSIAVQTGAQVRLVDVTEDYYLDIEDLKKKITSKSKVLILSYMRGYVGNVDAIVNLCQQHNIKVVEDCAHTMGLRWKGTPVGRKGIISCYSMQSYKMINAGEGGIFVTDDEDLCAKAILYAGAYERLWKSHINRPKDIAHLQKKIPCLNVRMNNITAAIIRAQLLTIHEKIEKQNQNYELLLKILSASEFIYIPKTTNELVIATDSLQFRLVGLSEKQKNHFLDLCKKDLPLQNFDGDNSRCFWNWHFFNAIDKCEYTKNLIQFTFDLKLPSKLNTEDIKFIGKVILTNLDAVATRQTTDVESELSLMQGQLNGI